MTKEPCMGDSEANETHAGRMRGPSCHFTAMVLAGGKSTRMGRDKAWLEVEGEPLISRQVALVKGLDPEAIFISGPAVKAFQGLGVPVVSDRFAGQGPLAGIERGLDLMPSPLLLVLAVDMPYMNAAVLRRLLQHVSGQTGVVPVVAGRVEPLAAIYPKSALASARTFLEEGCRSATQFAEWTIHLGITRRLSMPEAAWPAFTNWNTPADLKQG